MQYQNASNKWDRFRSYFTGINFHISPFHPTIYNTKFVKNIDNTLFIYLRAFIITIPVLIIYIYIYKIQGDSLYSSHAWYHLTLRYIFLTLKYSYKFLNTFIFFYKGFVNLFIIFYEVRMLFVLNFLVNIFFLLIVHTYDFSENIDPSTWIFECVVSQESFKMGIYIYIYRIEPLRARNISKFIPHEYNTATAILNNNILFYLNSVYCIL